MNLNHFKFYKRLVWTAQMFTDFQEAHVNSYRSSEGGAFQGAVIKGMDVTPVSGMTAAISAGVAVSATGYACIKEASENIVATAPSANFQRSLLVIRPKLINTNYITKPTSPFESVPLNQTQDSEFVIIDGTISATPEYPAKQAEDIVVAGLRLYSGQTTIADDDIDFNVREIPGLNGELGQRHLIKDDRLKPYRSDYRTLGIKPSQKLGKGQRAFAYAGKSTPSIYPKTAGAFTNTDATLNFGTGAIGGGDTDSSAFTPTIPTAGNSIVATVFMKNNDTVGVLYGTQGTRAQCLAAIKNMTTSGAGSVNLNTQGYKIAFVIVNSLSGAIADIEIFDLRAVGSVARGQPQINQSVANNQTVAADVTDFPVWKTTEVLASEFLYSVLKTTATGSEIQMGRVFIAWNSFTSAHVVSKMSTMDTADQVNDVVDFSVVATGNPNEFKLQYKSSNLSGGSYVGSLKITDIKHLNA